MTIEELLDYDAAKLAKMTDAELDAYFKPFYTVTRPELAPKPINNKPRSIKYSNNDPKRQLALAMLKSLGVDMDD